ncbi:MAG: Sir2 family NAD-dependent protein deacetylase [Thermoanaerobaculia bacterium]|nr:Sir2 family NAD-dependent protein deacetylase [Thermoanaerobaculia bacterium]
MAAPEPQTAAVRALAAAEALIVTAGAGLGVDSGLPDFRGPEGFWRAYPAAARLGLRFAELANPRWFDTDPTLAWGFYGHRFELYRRTAPHAGYGILARWLAAKPSFVFTSNVDGHFEKAGFEPERIVECHGSLEFLQCLTPCSRAIWPIGAPHLDIDTENLRARGELPRCPNCGRLARPNVLMFGDGRFVPDRTAAQEARFEEFLDEIRDRDTVVIELGAGSAVPTVRWTSEGLQRAGATLIRINPREPEGPRGTISLAGGAAAELAELAAALEASGQGQ